MKKAALGIIALAMSFMATTAHAATGDIRSIFPCDMYGNQVDPGSMATAKKTGETVYFCVRLENSDSSMCYNNNVQNPWMLKYSGMYNLETALLLTPPAVGVYVSGRLTAAKVLSMTPPADKPWYTDIVCSYTVKPGDMAFPMTLALANGKEVGSSTDSQYLFDTVPMSYSWSLYSYSHAGYADGAWGDVIATNKCTFAFGESSVFNTGAFSDEINSWVKDSDLRKAGLYIKTVDFAAEENTVPEGRTEKVLVNINGGVNTNGIGVVYAMVRDDATVSLAESGVETIEFPDSTNPEMTGTYQVAAVTIPSGADVSSFSFKVMGETQATNAVTVYLATTKGFVLDGGGKNMITNFITTSVRCVAPPPPYISVTLDGEASKSVTSNPNYKDYAAKLTVTLSEPHTSDVTVEVVPSMISGSVTNSIDKYIGMSTYSENGFLEKVKEVTFTAAEMAAGTLSKELYVYVLGADDDTDGVGKGIIFKPSKVAIFQNENVSAILYIKKSTPQIQYPAENQEYRGLAGGVSSAFTIKIADDYTNMQSPFTVEWKKTGSGSPQIISDVKVNSDGEATVNVRYNAGEYTTRFRVKNAAGVYSDERTIKVQVNPAKQVSAVIEDPDDSGEYNETEEELTVRFNLTEAYEDSTLYAFLVPLDAVSSNLVVCKAFDTGVAIRSGDTESTGTAKIQLLDGTDETLPLTYSIVLRTAKNWNSGETIGTYESKDLEIYINNVAPVVSAVNMSGSAPVTVNGGKFGGKASIGLNKIFTLEAEDVEADLTNDVKSVWTFSDPNGNAVSYSISGPLDDIVLTNVFEVAGVYTCTVKLQDKDMSSKKYGETFTFQVEVLETPSLNIVFPNSNTFKETDADYGLSYFYVDLSTPASKPIEVDIACTQMGASGVFNIATNRIYFRSGQVRQQVIIDELDGTADSASFKGGFSVTATVVTETENEDGIKYSKVYLPATEKMYVSNEPPVIVQPFDTGATNDAPINVNIPLKWKVADVDFDLNENLTITWITSEGDMFETNGTDVAEGLFTTKFKSGGDKTVTLTVMDKDGSSSKITLYYKVAASKQVYVYPMGPYDGGLTALSRRYASAAGIGEGRAWSSGTRVTEGFAHTYTYGATIGSAKINAVGYANGQEDKEINDSGNSFGDGDTPYTYSDRLNRDSFFYAWVVAAKGEESTGYIASPLISPVSPKAKSLVRDYQLSLPTKLEGEDKSNPMYADSFIEAFFAKELYPADNMGDMNADGIPDYFATLSWSMPTGEDKTIPEAMTGQSIAGSAGGEEGEGESATASDLANIATYNDDLDFIPVAQTSSNPLKPVDCGPGQPFTTLKEIRGFGMGLNEPGVSDYELTEAETCALYAAYALANPAPAADWAAATNWAKSVAWTPESVNELSGTRLNPLNPDTDGDGLGDAWEYYFWYYAKIGAVVNGTWGRLEGRRYDSVSPSMSQRISPEDIYAAFNPHLVRETEGAWGIDFDNDGLSDLEEFVLGTNPCDWDTDGDGASDMWEVLSGLNPCSTLDGLANPDCDFMARCDYAADTFTLYTFADGKVFGLPTATGSKVALAESAPTSACFKVELASGDICWVTASPTCYTIGENQYLAKDVDAFAVLEVEGAKLLGEKISLVAGTPVASVSTETEDVVSAVLPETGFAWTNPGTQEASTTAEALELFNYGGDGITWVPCTSNATTYAAIPAGVAVVKVQENVTVTLIHSQVNTQYGFDPRVAWNIDEYGFLANRWRTPDSDDAGSMGDAGVPTNTVPYASRDEYLVMQYRMNARRDIFPELSEGVPADVSTYSAYTTFPNLPLDFVRDEAYAHNPFTSSNETHLAYWDGLSKSASVHGADTDIDGVPDGWELYVGYNPNDILDAVSYVDGDKLSLAQEFAGVDSCNAYAARTTSSGEFPEVESITKNHPGKTDGWWNKFFPTNPDGDDTDGDGLKDHEERDSHSGPLPVGRNSYSGAKFTFIYGDTTGNEENLTSVCFRGGGLNPCSVDTDCDLLPDAWEYEFAGIIFEKGQPSVALNDADFLKLAQANGLQAAVGEGFELRGGMDGTFSGDANYDFDQDGLLNFQEYLVQSLRHLRYDDALTPLMGVDPTSKKFVCFLPFSAWDGNQFHKKCNESGFTGLGAWQFRDLGYFALPPHSWDPIACNSAGLSSCANYKHSEGAGYRVMLRPSVEIPMLGKVPATGYASTDPRRWDTDNDGMDDYYEIFHGLNPLLGSAADPAAINEQGFYNFQSYDVIGIIYGGSVNSWCNHWTGWTLGPQPAFDAIKYPWMIGTMECDADGDGLRNDEESLKVNVAKPQNTHTDPTPLWMTDSTSAKFASFTSQYYGPDPYLSETPEYNELNSHPDLFNYPWTYLRWNTVVYAPGSGGINRDWMFSFEENEGFDTDGDFKSDSTELVKGVEPTSDPLNFMDPNRRQALYLPGANSAAVSYDSESRRSIGTEPDLLKQFTVEFWVRPEVEQKNVVILERVCVYGASTLSNNEQVIRANFRVGTDDNGCVYGMFEGSTADSGKVLVTGNKLAAGAWTHLAFTFDGSTAALYENGAFSPVDFVNGAGLLPANGIDGILQESGTSVIPYTGYRALPCANIIGARARTANAVSVNSDTTWDDFSSFYKGWIDEVRVWDGARTPAEIHSDYLKRYTFEEVSALRENVYKSWRNGATRANPDPKLALPSELLLHYNFASLPGGVEPKNVICEPIGFDSGVLDNVRKTNGKDIDESLLVGWWSSLANINSRIYRNYAIIPWIRNTVAHLPLMDGSNVDSQYWNSYAAGLIGNFDSGYTYPNSANPYSSYVYRFDKLNHLNNLAVTATLQNYSGESMHNRYSFQLRSDFVGTTDLVPLGGAFAKRGIDFWDNLGAMDAWVATSADGGSVKVDENGIPKWAQDLGYKTVDAYIRALAEGLLPSGIVNPDYKNIADANNDGLYDWWQNFHDLKGNAKSDTDKDGLADFAEYLISSNAFKFAEISPVRAKTNGKEFDYFLKAGRLYLGELFADHDFMEDEWENRFAASVADSAVYDPSGDFDGDGWSNYAECRAGSLPDRTATITAEGQQLPDYPEPLIFVRAHYKKATQVDAPIVVKAYPEENRRDIEASWNIPGSDAAINYERVIGVNPGVKSQYTLGPGIVVPGTVSVYFRDPSELYVTSGSGVWGSPSASQWRLVLEETPIRGENGKANLSAVTENHGSLVYHTGLTEIDFAALPKYRYEISEKDKDNFDYTYTFYPPATNTFIRTNLEQSYVKIVWQSKRLADESKWSFALSRANSGYLREGLNTFVAFVDLDGNGEYTDGEPMGVTRNVNVGWNSANVDIQLTDNGSRFGLGMTEGETSLTRETNVKVSRLLVNGQSSVNNLKIVNPLILDFNIGNRGDLHDGDFMKNDELDIDWSAFDKDVLQSPMVKNNKMNVTSVTYRVELSSNTLLASNVFEFVRTFTPTHVVAKPCNVNAVNYGVRPVFKWTIPEGAETFTAFSVQVKDAGGNVVWNSGFTKMPLKSVSGEYEWQASVYVNDLVSAGNVFANTNNYTWQVSLHNSRYQSAAWSEPQHFRMNVYSPEEVNSTSYGTLKAAVKYFGPGAFSTDVSSMAGIVRVEAYTSPDFTGVPAGRGFIRDGVSVTNDSHEANVTIGGLEAGTYYLRAFIDSDGDNKRSDWESWGYVCPRGDIVSGGIFNPVAITVGAGAAPVEVCYIEDTDLDQDCLPDVYEYDEAGADKTDFLSKKDVAHNAHNGYITVNPELKPAIDKLIGTGANIGLLSMGGGQVPMQMASLALGLPSLENSIEESSLAIKSLALENEMVKLTLGAEANEPSLGTVFVSDGTVTATIVVKYADSLNGEWSATEVTKTFVINEGGVSDELSFSLRELGLDPSKGFFKVELK